MGNAKNKSSAAKRSKIMLLVGFAFFINPLLRGLDILPDVIGCLLIFFGLTQLAYFDGAIEKARKCFLYLAAVEGVRLFFMKSVFLTNISSNRMLAVTVFSILDGILYVMLFRQLFSGINYYSMRNNCNAALAKCDGTAFITYLAFFTRIAASLLPELLATVEIYLYADDNVEIDFETLDSIADIIAAKPLIEILLLFIALVVGVAWYVSMNGLIRTLFSETWEELDSRYAAEFSSRPEKTLPKKLRNATYVVYLALFFSLDLVFDGVRIVPASAMFLLLFLAAFCYKGISDFRSTKKLAPIAFILLLGAEIYRLFMLPVNNVIVIYKTELWKVGIGAVICLAAVTVCLLAVRGFLADIRTLSADLGFKPFSTQVPWVIYCVSAVLWSAGYVVPYFYSYVSTLRIIASALFIWQTVKLFSGILDAEEERASLYGK